MEGKASNPFPSIYSTFLPLSRYSLASNFEPALFNVLMKDALYFHLLLKQKQRNGVLASGNWIIDRIKMIDNWPAQDALSTIGAESIGNGGGPYNILKDLAKLQCGFPLTGVGLIGRDPGGESILRDCDAHNIDRRAIQQTDTAPTSYTDVMTVTATGRRTFFHQHGANALLGVEHFNLSNSSARIFYLGYMCLMTRLDKVCPDGRTPASQLFEQAKAQGMTTIADLVSNETSDFTAIINPSLKHLDYLFLNEYELARLVGMKASTSPISLEIQCRIALERGVCRAVIVHEPEGALCVTKDRQVFFQPSVRMPPNGIVGTAGAGDAFAAGCILGLHEDWDFQKCLELGVCVAAASLRDATCSGAIETWQKCLKLGQEWGYNPVFGLQ